MLSTLHHDYNFNPKDNLLHQSSICFDLSVVQIFSALTAGATVCIASAAVRKDPLLLADFMYRSSVTFTYFTPSQFALLLEYANESLQKCTDYRIAFSAGERLPVRVAKAFYDLKTPAILYNTWSPSELVVQTTVHEVAYPDPDCVSIPIGRPLANCRHYIMDSCLNPLPAGLEGEICVGGVQVGAGYLNNPDANAKSFLENHLCELEDRNRGWTKLFRTGDKGRFCPDGQLEFLGRIAGDKQIKLRGFRIDLGEVEQRIFLESSTMEGRSLVDVAVVAREPKTPERVLEAGSVQAKSTLTDDRQVIAFVVPRQDLSSQHKQSFVTSLHEKIEAHLNSYMLPNGYEFLGKLPVTIGGKIDRLNLLNRNLDLVLPSSSDFTHTSEEHKLQEPLDAKVVEPITKIFREALNLPKDHHIAPLDNFFSLGGTSILLLRVQSKIKRTLKITLSLTELFKVPTPAGIDSLIASKSQPRSKGAALGLPSKTISWSEETTLPNDTRYRVPPQAQNQSRANISKILLTGVDSYIGVHMLESILSAHESTTVYLLGTQQRLVQTALAEYLKKYDLFGPTVTLETLEARVHYIPGTLAEPHFGLDDKAFKALGQTIQAIYHLGGQISLLKAYTDLKQLNVSAVLDIIELATYGKSITEINHLSTWSVPHLQTWSTAHRTKSSILTSESSAEHFSPPVSDDLGYFKSRWVSEILMTKAAERGFKVSIYRASAVTASTVTRVPEPADDFIRRMTLGMIKCGAAPAIGNEHPQFAVDFIPVDHLVSNFYDLSSTDLPSPEIQNQNASIYHLGNPQPLPLAQLPALMGQIKNDGTIGRNTSVEEWLALASKDASRDEQLRWAVLRDYLKIGHVMFALERGATEKRLRDIGGSEGRAKCPGVDVEFLRGMWEMDVEAGKV